MRRRRGPWHPPLLGDAVRAELDRLGPGAALGPIVEVWPAAVGEAVAANAWPARLARDGTLVVAASSSVWAFELTALEATISVRLREALGGDAPARLRFVPGRLPERGVPSETAAAAPARVPSQAEREEGAALAAGIESEPLREAVARAAAASLARASNPRNDRSL
jgi:predicted nucleic acid-binding Zn ribbon protein